MKQMVNVEIRAGTVFDVVADVFFVMCSFTVLIRNNILPFWILIVAIVKFAEFCVSSSVSAKKSKTVTGVFIFDSLGRAAALLLYALSAVGIPAYVLLSLFSLLSSGYLAGSCFISKPGLSLYKIAIPLEIFISGHPSMDMNIMITTQSRTA